MKNDPQNLLRFTAAERANHWLVALCFVLVALSGLVFFYPAFYPLRQLFGGAVWARILHPFLGLLLSASFCLMFVKFRNLNRITATDREWLSHLRELLNGDEQALPEAGKFNGGQKLLFWLLVACVTLLLLSGIVIWRAYFSQLFPLWLIRFAQLIHAIAGAGMVALILGHIYMGIWTSESMAGMLYGQVRRPWARLHHRAWFRQMTGEDR